MASADPPAVSVVMPVYNGNRFLERAVASLHAQTFAGWELLAVDDASQDDSHARLCRLAVADERVRVFHRAANGGPAAARNDALRQARGELVAYLDCDDEFYPDYLQLTWGHRHRSEVLVFGYDLVEERPGHALCGRVRPYDPRPHAAQLFTVNIVVPLGVAHRRTLLARAGLFDERLRYEEDWDLWRRFAQAGAAFTFVPARSGRYHVRPGSQARVAGGRPPAPLPKEGRAE